MQRSAAIVNPPPSLSSPACRASVHAASQLAIPDTVQILYVTAAGAQHDMVGHAECAARIPAILEALDTHQLTPGFRPDEVHFQSPQSCAPNRQIFSACAQPARPGGGGGCAFTNKAAAFACAMHFRSFRGCPNPHRQALACDADNSSQ